MINRVAWVDHAKGAGILLVVYGHVARGVHKAGLPMDEGLFRLVDSVIYSFHMPLFFFLSGLYFVTSLQKHGAGGLMASKLRTIAWPYLVWSVLQGLLEVLLSSSTNGNVTVAEVASLLWHPRAQFWFLYALFLISLAALPLYRWLPSRWYPLAVVASGLAFVFSDYLPGGMPLVFLIRYLPYFTLGILFNEMVGRRQVARYLALRAGAALAAFVAFQYVFHGRLDLLYSTEHHALALSLAVVSVLAVVMLCMWLERFGLGFLAYLGRASLGIYVMHILAGSGVRIVMQRVLGIDSVAAHLVLGTALGVGLPLLALRLMERFGPGFLLELPRRHAPGELARITLPASGGTKN